MLQVAFPQRRQYNTIRYDSMYVDVSLLVVLECDSRLCKAETVLGRVNLLVIILKAKRSGGIHLSNELSVFKHLMIQ